METSEMIGLVEDLACSVGYACNESGILDFVGVSGDLKCQELERIMVRLGDF